MADHRARTASHDPSVPDALARNMAQGWTPQPRPAVREAGVAPYAARRRQELVGSWGDRLVAVCSGAPAWRNGDQHHRHRCSSEFLWLVGEALQDAVLLADAGEATLYVRRPTRFGDADHWQDRNWGGLWEGPRPELDELAVRLGLDVRPLDELDRTVAGRRPLVVGGRPPASTVTLDGPWRDTDGELRLVAFLDEARLVKDAYELSELRRAAAVTAEGFCDLARELRPGVTERWLEGSFVRRARHGGEDLGYQPIVAAGAHACVLHWFRNDGMVAPGELLLVDAGVELVSGYTADVTRVLPADGRFSPAQRRVHDAVARARDAAQAAVAAGVGFDEVHRAAMAQLCAELVEWGVLSGTVEELLESGLHRRFTLHGTSHMLGLDVHDCASAAPARYRGPLHEGMCLTVEPGLYFQLEDDTVPHELRGIGVRLEDDLAVTGDGCEVLSPQLPAHTDTVEAWLEGLRP